jgi:cytochrome P450
MTAEAYSGAAIFFPRKIDPILPPGMEFDDLFTTREPFATNEYMRIAHVLPMPMQVVNLSGYDSAVHVLKNESGEFSQEYMPQNIPVLRKVRHPNDGAAWSYDPPALHDVRKLVGSFFRPAAVDSMQGDIKNTSQTVLNEMLEQGEDGKLDIAAYGNAVNFRTVAGIVGGVSPEELAPKFARWIREFNAARSLASLPLQREMRRELLGLVRGRRETPTDDEGLLNYLLAQQARGQTIGGRRLTDEDIRSQVWSVIAAATETTTTAITNLLLFASQMEAIPALRGNPGLIRKFHDEALRYYPPFPTPLMKVVKNTRLEGTDLRKGQWVRLLLPAANRDEQKFSSPDLFNIYRTDQNKILSFGTGQHMCLGTHLANAVTREAVGAVAERLPRLRIPRDTQYKRARGMLHRFDSAIMEY